MCADQPQQQQEKVCTMFCDEFSSSSSSSWTPASTLEMGQLCGCSTSPQANWKVESYLASIFGEETNMSSGQIIVKTQWVGNFTCGWERTTAIVLTSWPIASPPTTCSTWRSNKHFQLVVHIPIYLDSLKCNSKGTMFWEFSSSSSSSSWPSSAPF